MAANAIYYLFGGPPMTGGDFVSVEHIAALNALGFDARVYYAGGDEGFAEFSVPVVPPKTPVKPRDVVVIGENRGAFFEQLRGTDCIKVQLNQNPYLTFHGFENIGKLNAYPFAHVITVSDFSANKLTEMGVTHPIARVRPSLPAYFTPAPKQLQIAYSPRKRPVEAAFLVEYFRSKTPEYAHVPWIPLGMETREKCAEVMGQSAIYAALPLLESLGLMSLEALACDCHVVGYTGHGGSEYATADNGDWIAEGAHEDFVTRLRGACRRFAETGANPFSTGARATAARFSQDVFAQELNSAWLSILGESTPLYRK